MNILRLARLVSDATDLAGRPLGEDELSRLIEGLDVDPPRSTATPEAQRAILEAFTAALSKDKIGMIKGFRSLTGVNIVEAKNAVETVIYGE